MKKTLFTFILFSLTLCAKAQFFGWGFDDDFFGPSQQEYAKAEYNGSKLEMEEFLKANFNSPANQRDVNGTIIVTCIIDEGGNVVDTKLTRGLRRSFDQEALRVAALMKFKPVAGSESGNNASGSGATHDDTTAGNSGSTQGSTNGDYSSGNSSSYDNDTGGSTRRNNDTRQNSNRNNRRNNRVQRESRRQFSVEFPIKKGRLNFLNLETITI